MIFNAIVSKGVSKGVSKLPVIAFVSAALLLNGCSSERTDVDYIDLAAQHQAKGDFKASIIELKNALRLNEQNAQARWLLGKGYLELGDATSAEKELRRAAEYGMARTQWVLPLSRTLLLLEQYDQVLDVANINLELASEDLVSLLAIRGEAYLALGRLDDAAKALNLAIAQQPDSVDAGLGQALLAAAKGDFFEARRWLEVVLERDPLMTVGWSLLGDLEHSQGHPKQAELAYGKAISLRPNNAGDVLKRALVRISVADYDGAAVDLAVLQQRFPDRPSTSYVRGVLEYHQDNYAAASAAFQQTLGLAPDYMPALFYSGASNYMLENYELSQRQLGRYLNAHPESTQAANMMGMILRRNKDSQGARAMFEQALIHDSSDLAALKSMANIAFTEGNVQEGITYFQQVVEQSQDAGDAYMNMALNLITKGEFTQAQSMLQSATNSNPDLIPKAKLLIIIGHLNLEEFDEAIALALNLRKQYPDVAGVSSILAKGYVGAGQDAKAREAYRDALLVAPGDPLAGSGLARLEVKQGNYAQAIIRYREVLDVHPADLVALTSLADLQFRQGERHEAEKLLEFAVLKHPSAIEPRKILAGHYLQTGQSSKVSAVVRGALPSQENDPELLEILGESQLAMKDQRAGLATFDRYLALYPASAQAHYLRGKALAQMQQLSKSMDAFNEALKLDPNHTLSKMAKSQLWIEQDKPNEAAHILAELLGKKPDSEGIVLTLASMYERSGYPDRAVSLLRPLLEQVPESAVLLNNLAWYLRDISPKEALGYSEMAMKFTPDNVAVLDTYGELLAKTGRYEAALMVMDRAAPMSKQPAYFKLQRIQILIQSGNKEAAKEALGALRMAGIPINLLPMAEVLSKQLASQ